MLAREVRILFGKEWRQLLRSRGAMATALLLPLLLMVVIPCLQLLSLKVVGTPRPVNLPPGVELPRGLRELTQDPQAMMPTKMRHIRTDPRSRMVDLSASYSAILNILRLFGYFSLGNSIGRLLEYR